MIPELLPLTGDPQIERLYARFSSLDKQSHGYLTREDFLRSLTLIPPLHLLIVPDMTHADNGAGELTRNPRIPELAINPLGDRIVHAFFYESKNREEEKVDFKVSQLYEGPNGLVKAVFHEKHDARSEAAITKTYFE